VATHAITTPEGFREAVRELDAQLGVLSVDEASTAIGRIKGAAPKAARRFPADDLADLLIEAEALKDRVRRMWKRQRSKNMYSAAGGLLLAVLGGWLGRTTPEPRLPAVVPLALLVLGVLFTLISARSVAESTDWRDEVAKPIDEVSSILAKELAERTDRAGPYRADAAPASTPRRVDVTMDPAPDDAAAPAAPARRTRE